jgi:hypothetical protein
MSDLKNRVKKDRWGTRAGWDTMPIRQYRRLVVTVHGREGVCDCRDVDVARKPLKVLVRNQGTQSM